MVHGGWLCLTLSLSTALPTDTLEQDIQEFVAAHSYRLMSFYVEQEVEKRIFVSGIRVSEPPLCVCFGMVTLLISCFISSRSIRIAIVIVNLSQSLCYPIVLTKCDTHNDYCYYSPTTTILRCISIDLILYRRTRWYSPTTSQTTMHLSWHFLPILPEISEDKCSLLTYLLRTCLQWVYSKLIKVGGLLILSCVCVMVHDVSHRLH